ncbi:hypothetical protein FB446DRAFT_792295 [Lentinula raphanica]|nr:hypothetical protein FB446DRAFT_792295 [Lentinula raphanica]
MDKYSCIAWHTNPNVSASLTEAERELARKLFANFDVAWKHPALQECLRRHIHMAQLDHQSSNLNTMTVFSVIWKHECPGSHNSRSVWTAMRAELNGVLAELIARFHAHTKGEDGTEETSKVRIYSRGNQVQHRPKGTTTSMGLSFPKQAESSESISLMVPVHGQLAGEDFSALFSMTQPSNILGI